MYPGFATQYLRQMRDFRFEDYDAVVPEAQPRVATSDELVGQPLERAALVAQRDLEALHRVVAQPLLERLQEREGGDSEREHADADKHRDDPRTQPEVHGSGLADAVPGSSDGDDQLWILRHRLELLAEMADVNVDRARLPVVGAPADSLEELSATEHDSGLRGEQRKQLELHERQRDGLSANFDRPSG